MSGMVDFRVLELLNARLCHELVSQVGAINNGVELLGEDDPDFMRDAIALIGQSARKAGQRLQFYRFAYGTSGSTGSSAAASPRDLAEGLLEGGKVRCAWSADAAALAGEWQRLACNMLVIATEVLPRGGSVAVRPVAAGGEGIEVVAEGDTVNVTPEMRGALDPAAPVYQLTSRTVHAYFTARLAGRMGAGLVIAEAGPGRALFRAVAG